MKKLITLAVLMVILASCQTVADPSLSDDPLQFAHSKLVMSAPDKDGWTHFTFFLGEGFTGPSQREFTAIEIPNNNPAYPNCRMFAYGTPGVDEYYIVIGPDFWEYWHNTTMMAGDRK